jgi:hypothetical protein
MRILCQGDEMSKANIKSGYLDIFCVFQLYENKNRKKDINKFIQIINKLLETNIIISSDNPNKEVYHTDHFFTELGNRKRTYRDCLKEGKAQPLYLSGDIRKVSEKPTAFVSQSASVIRVELESDIEDDLELSQIKHIHKLLAMYNLEEKHTGIPSKEYKNRFQLFPPRISYDGTNSFYPGIFLTLFKNGYAILHLSTELHDFDFEDINNSA